MGNTDTTQKLYTESLTDGSSDAVRTASRNQFTRYLRDGSRGTVESILALADFAKARGDNSIANTLPAAYMEGLSGAIYRSGNALALALEIAGKYPDLHAKIPEAVVKTIADGSGPRAGVWNGFGVIRDSLPNMLPEIDRGLKQRGHFIYLVTEADKFPPIIVSVGNDATVTVNTEKNHGTAIVGVMKHWASTKHITDDARNRNINESIHLLSDAAEEMLNRKAANPADKAAAEAARKVVEQLTACIVIVDEPKARKGVKDLVTAKMRERVQKIANAL